MAKKKKLETFLKVYCKQITDSNDYRLSSFVSGLQRNPRCEGPILLYAALYLPEEKWIISKLNKKQLDNYNKTIESIRNYKDINTLSKQLPIEQSKALDAYYSYINENSSDNSLKKTYQQWISEKIKDSKISNYKICKDNNINHGNLYAFLLGEYDKLSLKKCEQLYQYLLLL